MADTKPTLNELAARITELAATFTNQLQENKIPQATFAADSVLSYEGITGDMFMTRQLLNDALNDMYILSQGPTESVYNYVHNVRLPLLPSSPLPRRPPWNGIWDVRSRC